MPFFMSAIVILVMVALAVCLVVTVTSVAAPSRVGRPTVGPEPPPPVDLAQEELRLRYARGEIDREEYLQRRIDLE